MPFFFFREKKRRQKKKSNEILRIHSRFPRPPPAEFLTRQNPTITPTIGTPFRLTPTSNPARHQQARCKGFPQTKFPVQFEWARTTLYSPPPQSNLRRKNRRLCSVEKSAGCSSAVRRSLADPHKLDSGCDVGERTCDARSLS